MELLIMISYGAFASAFGCLAMEIRPPKGWVDWVRNITFGAVWPLSGVMVLFAAGGALIQALRDRKKP